MKQYASSWLRSGSVKRVVLWMILGVGAAGFVTHYVVTTLDVNNRLNRLNGVVGELARRQLDMQNREADRQETEDTSLVRVGDPVPAFEVTTLDGQVVRSADLGGRVTLLNLFTTSCGPCMQEMPEIQKRIWEPFRSKGLVVIAAAVGSDDTMEKIQAFAARHECTFTFAKAKRDVFDQFATYGVPRCYVISPEGRIRFMSLGYGETLKPEFERLARMVEAELERPNAAHPSQATGPSTENLSSKPAG